MLGVQALVKAKRRLRFKTNSDTNNLTAYNRVYIAYSKNQMFHRQMKIYVNHKIKLERILIYVSSPFSAQTRAATSSVVLCRPEYTLHKPYKSFCH